MATLTVWKFDSTMGAQRAEELLASLQKQELIQVHDAATVYWEEGKKSPKTKQANNLTGAGALGGMFWGMLFGLLFFVPILGAALGAAGGALAGSLSDVGIDDDFIAEIRSKVTPGTSALFAMTSDAVEDKVKNAFDEADLHGELLATNLSSDQESALREVFGS